mmetsp:Transcript_59901/g.195581  ORF Transcript_59901/g.195581 Transcript_59901/m.195581 type:complete len:418 (+) Transcript_59901:2530-3783(+)
MLIAIHIGYHEGNHGRREGHEAQGGRAEVTAMGEADAGDLRQVLGQTILAVRHCRNHVFGAHACTGLDASLDLQGYIVFAQKTSTGRRDHERRCGRQGHTALVTFQVHDPIRGDIGGVGNAQGDYPLNAVLDEVCQLRDVHPVDKQHQPCRARHVPQSHHVVSVRDHRRPHHARVAVPNGRLELAHLHLRVVVGVQLVEHALGLHLGEGRLEALGGHDELLGDRAVVVVRVQQPEVVLRQSLPRERNPSFLVEDLPEGREGHVVVRVLRHLVRGGQVVEDLWFRQVRLRSRGDRRRSGRRGRDGGHRARVWIRGRRRGPRDRGGDGCLRGGCGRGGLEEVPRLDGLHHLRLPHLAAGVGVQRVEGEGRLLLAQGWLERGGAPDELMDVQRLFVQGSVDVVGGCVHLGESGLDRRIRS